MSRIETWFDEGLIKEAILGKGKYFIPDYTYRDTHDDLTILTNLDEWAVTDEKKAQASLAFYACIDEHIDAGNIKEAMDLVRVYLINKKYNCSNFLVIDDLINLTKSMISEYRLKLSDETIGDLEYLFAYINDVES